MSTLGERIRTVRKSLGLTQEGFVENLGVTQSYLSRVEINNENPADTLLFLICKEYGVNKEWLINGADTNTFIIEATKEPMMNEVMKQSALEHLKECGLPISLIQCVDCSTLENMETSLQKLKDCFYSVMMENIKEKYSVHSKQYSSDFDNMNCTEESNPYIADLFATLANDTKIGMVSEKVSALHKKQIVIDEKITERLDGDKERLLYKLYDLEGDIHSVITKEAFITGFKTAFQLFLEAIN